MTQTCHDALDPNCTKGKSKYAPSPGGNRPSAVFSIHHTITKWIFDLDWYSHFLAPVTPWRTKQFSCYPWTVTTPLNRVALQHVSAAPCRTSKVLSYEELQKKKKKLTQRQSNTNFKTKWHCQIELMELYFPLMRFHLSSSLVSSRNNNNTESIKMLNWHKVSNHFLPSLYQEQQPAALR